MPADTYQRSTNGTSTTGDQAPERLQEAASGIADQAGRTATSQLSKTMTTAGDTLEQVARAVRESGNQLRQERPEIAGVVDTVAEKVEATSSYLREHDAREVLGEAERFARRQPALIVGGGLALGLLIGRVLRSGAEPATSGSSMGSFANGRWSTESAASLPGSGYGTGYGASYDPTTGGSSDIGDRLEATDRAAGDEALDATGTGRMSSTLGSASGSGTSSATSSSSTTKRRARSTGAE